MVLSVKNMFKNSKIEEVDLSGINLTEDTITEGMFKGTKVKSIIVKNEKHAEIIKKSTGFPEGVTFIIKE